MKNLQKPKVSVVIATLNRQELLITMLKKLMQDKEDIDEIIIVDQTEVLSENLKKYLDVNPLIRYYYFEEKKLTAARNKGLELAKGEIVFFLDDDAMIFKGLIKAHLNNYKDSLVGAVTGREILESDPDFYTKGKAQIITQSGDIIPNRTSKTKSEVDSCWGANMSFRTKIAKELGGFDNDILLIRDESDLSMRLRLSGYKIIFEPEAKVIHQVAKSGGTRFDKRLMWYHKFFHDEVYFQLKFFSHKYLWHFYARKIRPILACMFWYGKAHPKALVLPFLAIRAGKKTYLKNKCTQYVPRRFGIDAHHLVAESKTGKEEYGYNLLKELAKINEPNIYFIYAKQKPDFKLPYKFNWQVVGTSGFFWYLAVLIKIFRDEIKILYAPTSYVLASILPKKSIPVVHDLAFLRSEFKNLNKAQWIEKLLIRRFDYCPKIITVSNFTKNDLHKNFPQINLDKIEIVYPGLKFKHKNVNSAKEKKTLDKFKLFKSYVLAVGTIEPRKNFQGLIRAYLKTPKSFQKKYDLVFVGKPGWENEEIYNLAKSAKNRVKFLGYISDKELRAIFYKASIFALPSFWEGFGIPVLEAFYFKVPVLCSNISSLPEVANEAAVLVDPKNIDEITKALIALNDEKFRQKLIRKGKRRLKLFSYQKSAQKLNQILIKSLC